MPLPRLLRLAAGLCAVAAAPTVTSGAESPRPALGEIRIIDAHSHVFEDVPALNALLRQINLTTINVCVPGADGHLAEMHRLAHTLQQAHPDLFPFTATFDLRSFHEPNFAARTIAWLDEQFRLGAVAVKIWKEVGMELKDRDGKFILPDDPRFDPIYAHLAQRGKPLHAHLAEPIDAWRPLDPDSPHYGYYSQNPQWHLHGKAGYPSHAELIAARDHILEKHPMLVVVGAHLGSLEHDLDALAARLARFPRFHVDVAARTRNLARHPSARVRDLFQRFPDRLLYGLDATWKPYLRPQPPTDLQRRAHVQMLDQRYRADFEYYAGTGAMTYSGRPTERLGLPREVLEKFYHTNAERVFALRSTSSK